MSDEHRIGADDPFNLTPLMGALRFHKWAESQLPPEVWKHSGGHLVFGAHRVLDDSFFFLSMAPLRKPEPARRRNTKNAQAADRLIDKFHRAYKRITSERIAAWYSDLAVEDARYVRAFFRAVAKSDPLIRGALDVILTRELSKQEGLRLKVEIEKSGRPLVALRDAFMLTAMVVVHESQGFELDDGTRRDCATRVARRFGEEVGKVRNQWKRHRTRAAVTEDMATDHNPGWKLWREAIEVRENDPVRAAALERLAKTIWRHVRQCTTGRKIVASEWLTTLRLPPLPPFVTCPDQHYRTGPDGRLSEVFDNVENHPHS